MTIKGMEFDNKKVNAALMKLDVKKSEEWDSVMKRSSVEVTN